MKTNKLVIGILAHVDSGKTTLAESMLYNCGSIRKLGRVDHKDAFLDTYELERNRGITIFAKQAQMKLGNFEIALLDTPGHVDFSAEMERTLQVLDYAILVISGADGVQGHTRTLWKLLKRYNIPVFIFVNKMDQAGTDRIKLLEELQNRLDDHCIDFACDDSEEFYESVAVCDEELMDTYIEKGSIERDSIRKAILDRKIFPCLFGSALKQTGVKEFLEIIEMYADQKEYPQGFGARVFKIARDEQNNRLTYMKITGGSLKVKTMLSNEDCKSVNEDVWNDKVDQIRIYSGNQFVTVNEIEAGMVCAVTGLGKTYSGEGLGIEKEPELPVLEPVLTYQIKLPSNCNVHDTFLKLCQLEEEEPELHITWNEALNEVHAQVMGEVQIEILKSLIKERFNIDVEFGSGNIVYKETIKEATVGIGHFEPLRHYAEVHLLMEPLESGSGLEFAVDCSEDILDKNWQRLILTHLEEKKHKGVLTGSEITDMKITLITGKAHQKHTEGGDFRQATYRAIRQGLMSSESILLEPIYEFRLEIPNDCVGRAMSDIQRRNGTFEQPETEGEMTVITGSAPVVTMRDYQMEVMSYSHGNGHLSCNLKGYEPCHNSDEVIMNIGYNAEADIDNPADSVFCSHGAGVIVPWYDVPEHAHVDNGITRSEEKEEIEWDNLTPKERLSMSDGMIAQEEIDEIFERTFGSVKKERAGWSRTIKASQNTGYTNEYKPVKYGDDKEYMLVDGYNIIFGWEELNELAKVNIDSARDKLMDIMCNYQGYKKNILILVFDAYKVSGGQGEVFDYHNIHVVYTKEAETADQYIEKVTHQIGKKHRVTVATSDRLEQMIIWGAGARRLSAKGLLEEVEEANKELRNQIKSNQQNSQNRKNYLMDNLSSEASDILKKIK